jgi:hypothetical protein
MEIMESVTFDFRHCFRGFCEGGVRPGDFREGLATRVMSTDEGRRRGRGISAIICMVLGRVGRERTQGTQKEAADGNSGKRGV